MKKMTASCLILVLAGAAEAMAAPYVIEPDDYPDRTVLNTILPEVILSVLNEANEPLPFYVTANVDGQGLAPTGDSVFGRANVTFWNHHGRLKMAFLTVVTSVSLDFAGGAAVEPETGQLEVYDAADRLLETYVTGPCGFGEAETMAVTRPAGDIAYAIAYVAEGNGTFGRLDHLTFVPEPATMSLLGLGLALVCRRRK